MRPRPVGTRPRWAEFGQSDVAENEKGSECCLLGGGDKGDRTPDLVNAIHALSQLSYIPEPRPGFYRRGAGVSRVDAARAGDPVVSRPSWEGRRPGACTRR